MSFDDRIPVELVVSEEMPVTSGEGAGEALAWLVESGVAAAGDAERFGLGGAHVAGCACCGTRGAAAEALRRLFLRRARGEVGAFGRVVAVGSAAAMAAVVQALREDVFVSGRFRAVTESNIRPDSVILTENLRSSSMS